MIKDRWFPNVILGFLVMWGMSVHGEIYRVGDSFIGFAAVDQQGKEFTFKAGNTRFILFQTAGESGEASPPKDSDWFEKHRALLLVNISDLSAFKRRIARSRMKSRPFQILVVDNADVAARFPQEKGKFTVFRLDDKGVLTTIQYAAPGKELQDLVSAPSTP